ncbi:hypothetical protein MMC25_007115 [Agyrium rufum]|nr:hypothetical protein [Agyrium rufum]
MFLAAAPYFQSRFSSSPWILTHFQPAILTVTTVTTLLLMLVLTRLQAHASYPRRIITSLLLNMVVFTLLALSTSFFISVSAKAYFVFLILMVGVSSAATAFCQNGLFAYVMGFGMPEYTQGIMTGQGIAGVLPPIAQIISVLSVPAGAGGENQENPKSAFAYFMTATVVSVTTLLAFLYMLREQQRQGPRRTSKLDGGISTDSITGDDEEDDNGADAPNPPAPSVKASIPLLTLFDKLLFHSLAIFVTFAITMVQPVFTQEIISVRDPNSSPPPPRILQPATFIPLGFFFWNLGDLTGRLTSVLPFLIRLTHHPKTLFILAIARSVWIPLYVLCNINGRGAVVNSDAFYLFVVQFLYGLTSGCLGSLCMIGAQHWVEDEEREAAGSFMGLMLIMGLTVGSLASFLVAEL